jgi:hypothetical protein
MKNNVRVFYKGRPYQYKVTATENGIRHFSLYKHGELVHVVAEEDLDKRWPLTILVDPYFNEVKIAAVV